MLDTTTTTNYIPAPTGCGSDAMDPMPSGSRITADHRESGGPITERREGLRWHVVATLGGQEHRAYFELLNQSFDAYLPLCIYSDRIVPLFRNYIFTAFDPDIDQWGKVLNTRGVYSLLRSASGRPAPVPVGCVEDLIARTSERRIVDDPGVTASLPSRIPLGASCEVTEGPLAGWKGVATLSTEKRVRLLLALFGGDREVEFKAGAVKVA